MRVRGCCAVALLALAAGAAVGQDEVIYEVNAAAYRPDLSTAPSLAVGREQIVVLGSHRMMLFDKFVPIDPASSTSLLDGSNWGGIPEYAGYRFQPALPSFAPSATGLIYPRADYDPITQNVWMLYSENSGQEGANPFEPAQPDREYVFGACA